MEVPAAPTSKCVLLLSNAASITRVSSESERFSMSYALYDNAFKINALLLMLLDAGRLISRLIYSDESDSGFEDIIYI